MPNEIRNMVIPFLAFLLTRPAWLFVFVASHVCPRTTRRILLAWVDMNGRHGRMHAPRQLDMEAAIEHLHNGGDLDVTKRWECAACGAVVYGNAKHECPGPPLQFGDPRWKPPRRNPCECMEYANQRAGTECRWCAARRVAREEL